MKKKQPEVLTIRTDVFYRRVAWLIRHGAHQEANALISLAQWFDPPFKVDEARIERTVAEQEANADRIHDPMNWS